MKKILLFFMILVISCCLHGRTEAKISYIQEYKFNILDTLLPSKDTKSVDNGCPENFPIPETEKPTGSGINCQTDNHKYNGMKCYACTGPCDNMALWPYSEEDCEGLSPNPDSSNKCESVGTGKIRYKTCCPSGYYLAKELTGGGKNSLFVYDSKENTEGTITCYKPLGCASGSSIDETVIPEFDIVKSGSAYKATKKRRSCTSLTVVPVFVNQNSKNFYCATGYTCNSPYCKEGPSMISGAICVSTPTKDNALLSYYDTNCYYYPGCATDTSNCFSYGNYPENMNITVSTPVNFWYPNTDGSDTNKQCLRFNDCKYDATDDHLYGSEYLVTGTGINIEAKTLGEGTRQRKCYSYTCKQGWTGTHGTGSRTISQLSEGDTYEVSYVQNSLNWFACRKAKPVYRDCFKDCYTGAWYNSTTQNCSSGDTSNQILISKTTASAAIAELRELSNKKWSELTGLNASGFITQEEANSIVIPLLNRYGVDHCFVVKKNGGRQVVRLTADQQFVEINSSQDFETCQ